jgi:hypothetical protein
MNKFYKILLDGKEIGTTQLEKADAPMGVAFGEIQFSSEEVGYEYLLSYCKEKNILISEYPEDNFFQTHESVESLKILNEDGIEIKGLGNQLSVIKDETYEISVQGIPYPFYEEEFPHHVKAYNEMFKE